MLRRLVKGLTNLLIAAFAIYGALLLLLWVAQRSLLFPVPDGEGPSPGLADAQHFGLATPDGERLSGFFLPPRDALAPSILYFHGNAERLGDIAGRARRYTDAGYGFMAVAYRGYPGSTGRPSEKGLILDGLTAFDGLRRRVAGDIVLHGLSLGTGVAVAVATKRDAAALILEAPFSSAVDVAADLYPIFPVRLLMRDPFRSDRRIADVHEPLLVLHGVRDAVIPIRYGRRLFELANADKRFVRLDDAAHADVFDLGFEAIADFLAARNLLPPTR